MRIEWAMFTVLLCMTTAKADGMTTREPVGSESCTSCKDSIDASFLKCQTNHPNSPSFKLMICVAESLDFSCRNLDCICASIPMACKDLDDLYTAETTENMSWRNCTYECVESIAASNNECGSNLTCIKASPSDLFCESCAQSLARVDLLSALSSYPFCCKTKTVGGIAYTRVPRLTTDKPFSRCINDCVYTRDDSPGSKFCFARGKLNTECTVKENPKHVTGNSAYEDVVIHNGLSVKLQGLVEYEDCESDIFAVEGGNTSSNIQRGSCLVTNVHYFGFGLTCQTHFSTPTGDSLFSIKDTKTGCKFENDTAPSNVNTRYDRVAVQNQYENPSTFSGVVNFAGWRCASFSGLQYEKKTNIYRAGYLVTSIYAFNTADSNSVNCRYSSSGTGYSQFHIYQHSSSCEIKSSHSCFSGNSLIQTPDGPKVLTDLRLGESVLTYKEGHGSMFTKFLGWMDRHSSATSKLLQFTTTDGSSTTLSASHVIFKMSAEGGLETVYAGSLVPGDKLAQMTETGLQEREVVAVEEKWELGYWAPLTNEGTILVDGFLASCYASYPHWISDLALAPVKMFPTLFLDDDASQHEDGVRGPVKILKELGALVGVRRSEPTKKMTENLGMFEIMTSSIGMQSENIEL